MALRSEFEGVGKQVLENLQETLGIRDQTAARQVRVDIGYEAQIAALRHVPEVAVNRVADGGERQFLGLDRHRARFDLRKIQDVADEVQQVGAGAVNRAGEFHLLGREVALRIVHQLLSENEDAVERRAQFVRHVRQKL